MKNTQLRQVMSHGSKRFHRAIKRFVELSDNPSVDTIRHRIDLIELPRLPNCGPKTVHEVMTAFYCDSCHRSDLQAPCQSCRVYQRLVKNQPTKGETAS
jgi:hypothetical protein